MRKTQYMNFFLLTFICCLLPSIVFAYPNKKNGFRDLEWGKDFEKVKDQIIFYKDYGFDTKSYSRQNENHNYERFLNEIR